MTASLLLRHVNLFHGQTYPSQRERVSLTGKRTLSKAMFFQVMLKPSQANASQVTKGHLLDSSTVSASPALEPGSVKRGILCSSVLLRAKVVLKGGEPCSYSQSCRRSVTGF